MYDFFNNDMYNYSKLVKNEKMSDPNKNLKGQQSFIIYLSLNISLRDPKREKKKLLFNP